MSRDGAERRADDPAPPPARPTSPLSRARAALHAHARRLLAANTSPARLAAAVFVGAIVGCSPFFGLHLFLCVGLAWLLRLNQPAVYAAANISIPPIAPFLGFAGVQLGERILHGHFLPFDLDGFRALAATEGGPHRVAARFFLSWLVGGVVEGALIGAAMAAAIYPLALRRARHAADPIRRAIVAATRRYAGAPRRLRRYAFFKYRLDPCYRAIAALIPEGSYTVDLGTGLGMLPLLIALLPGARRALGVEWDEVKLAAGRAAVTDLPMVELREGDVRDVELPRCDVITLVDVLHYYDAATQQRLLSRCARALAPGGLLLIREGDAVRDGGGARWTRFIERQSVRVGWNRAPRADGFRAAADLRSVLRALGYTVQTQAAAGRLHPGNVLLIASSPASEGGLAEPSAPAGAHEMGDAAIARP